MNDIQVRNIVKEEITIAFEKFEAKMMSYFDRVFQDIEPFESNFETLNGNMKDLETKVDSIYEEQLVQKLSIVNIENTLNGYGDMYTINSEKTEELDKRVYKLETKTKPMILRDGNSDE
jgi:polyhydroxyalkanoate synthesis regulator phasin